MGVGALSLPRGFNLSLFFPWTRGLGVHLWRRWENNVGTDALWGTCSSSAARQACEGLYLEPLMVPRRDPLQDALGRSPGLPSTTEPVSLS